MSTASNGTDDATSTGKSAAPHAVVIERVFDAPVELVWQMWTDPGHFAAWYGPTGATITVATMEVRVGGRRLVRMDVETPNGPMQMWFTGEYREVVEPTLLVYTDAVSDEHGTVSPPSGAGPGHPQTTEVRVELQRLGDRTAVVMTHVGIPADSPGAVGWAMALDKLAAHVASLSGR